MLLNCFTKKVDDPNELTSMIPLIADSTNVPNNMKNSNNMANNNNNKSVPNNTDAQPNRPKKDLGPARPTAGPNVASKVQEPKKVANSSVVNELKEKLLERSQTFSEKPSRIPKREVTPIQIRKSSNSSGVSERVIDNCIALDWMESKCLENGRKGTDQSPKNKGVAVNGRGNSFDSSRKADDFSLRNKKRIKRKIDRDSNGFSSSSSSGSQRKTKVDPAMARKTAAKERWTRSMELLRANKQESDWKSDPAEKSKDFADYCGLSRNKQDDGSKKSNAANSNPIDLAEFCGINRKEVGLKKPDTDDAKPKDLTEFCGFPLNRKEAGLVKKDTPMKKPQQERSRSENSAVPKEIAGPKPYDKTSLPDKIVSADCHLNACFVGPPCKDPYMKKTVGSKVASIRDSQNISHIDASKKFASAKRKMMCMQKELAEKENQFFKAEEEFLLSKCILEQTRGSCLQTAQGQPDLHSKLHNLPEAWIQLTLQFSESRRRIIEWLLRNQVKIESSFYEKETEELRKNVELTKTRSNERIHEVFDLISSLTEDSKSKLKILESQDGVRGKLMVVRSHRDKDVQTQESPENKQKFKDAALNEFKKIKGNKSALMERDTNNKIRVINNRIRHLEKVANTLLNQKRSEKGLKKKNPELLGIIRKTIEDKQKHIDKLSSMIVVMETNMAKVQKHRSKLEHRITAINEKLKKREKMRWGCI